MYSRPMLMICKQIFKLKHTFFLLMHDETIQMFQVMQYATTSQ